ncbi:unnamed protein product [Ascophyllum nodosum]
MAQGGSGSNNRDSSAAEENWKGSEEAKGADAAAASIDDQDETKKAFYALPEGVRATVMNALATPMGSTTDGDDWARGVGPEWKANHDLKWANLTDLKEIGHGLTCTVYTAKIPGRRGKVIAKVARRRNKGRLEDQAERQMEAEFNVLRQASCAARIAYKGSSVKHPHVVELLGAGFTNGGRRFIVLEHLPEGTLGTFRALSSREEMHGPSPYTKIKKGLRKLSRDFHLKLTRVLQVAEALEYLQTDAIPGALVLHRDLRPDNVGMGRGGVVKIFDFGLSKALAVSGNGLVIPMVGEAGSLRYAAPEVAMGLPHGGKADVYSWSLLAWSVASSKQPFEGIGRSAFYDRVVIGGERPLVDEHWPHEFGHLLQECWSGEPFARPKISKVVVRMKAIVHE